MSYNQEEDFSTQNHLDRGLWKKMWKMFISPYKKILFKSFFYMAFVAVVDLIFPILTQYAIDNFIAKKTTAGLWLFVILCFVFFIMQAYFVYRFIYNNGILEGTMVYELRKTSFEKLQNQSFSYFDKTASGWIIARITSDIQRLADIFSWVFVDAIWGIVLALGIVIVLGFINFYLLLIMLLILPVIALVSFFFQKRLLKNWREVRRVNSIITGRFSEGIMGAKTTKVMAIEEGHIGEFKNDAGQLRQKSLHASRLSSIFGPLIHMVTLISSGMILIGSGIEVVNGTMKIGVLMMFVQYAAMFFQPIRNLSGLFSELQMAQASAERLISFLEKPIEITDSEEVVEKYGTILNPKLSSYEPMIGHIRFDHVDFAYVENEPVLKDFNLTIEAGQTIALVGETGSGKSTITNLIARFYEPTKGHIYIDHVDYKSRSLGWLHSHLGVVLQTPHLFSGTVAENIRFAKADATMEEIVNAARIVDAHEFIMKLENGYDTQVGEGGNLLSTGQKQLICFARALIDNPSLVILDEASASIDSATEYKITQAIEVLLKNRTAIVVAHRLSTIVNADKILVIDKGLIKEQGTHRELMALKGHYYELYTNQFNQERQAQLFGGTYESNTN